ncbi:tetratricopeptide repeat protein [Catenovulum adriaticum]|uniref:Tetratricopeptide repeat protein n=1 Tax=Catenovulum adriaticum TaxID=2984846 RepID=A0ABY7ALE8_9ALTE|nr:tetratricopeptide repeat protein [Catenovulum sp. TS8]WAJ70058.1 hypothetical protein OLW01_13075 [Catenovulum sp. TS8]
MSVINQMLKDLDKRQSNQADPGVDYPKIPVQPEQTAASKNRYWLFAIISLVIVITGLGIANWLKQPESTQPSHPLAEMNNRDITSQAPEKTSLKPLTIKDENTQQNLAKAAKKALVPAVMYQAAQTSKQEPPSSIQNPDQNSNSQASLKTDPIVNTSSNASENNPVQQNDISANNTETVKNTAKNTTPPATDDAFVNINNQLKTSTQAATDNINKASNQQDDRFMSINPTQQSNTKIAHNKLEQAKALLDKGQFVKAEQLLQSALTLQPDLHKARITWMSIRYGEQNLPAALAVLQQGIKSYPDHLAYHLLAARILLEMDKPDLAWTLIENQHPPISSNTGFYQLKASLAQQLNLAKQALKNWQALLSINSMQANWQLGAAIAAEQAELPAQAIIHYQKAFNLGGLSKASRQFIQQKLASLQP